MGVTVLRRLKYVQPLPCQRKAVGRYDVGEAKIVLKVSKFNKNGKNNGITDDCRQVECSEKMWEER